MTIKKTGVMSPPLYPRSSAYIDGFGIDEALRGQGIGTRLMEAAKGWARERGLDNLQLGVWLANLGAIRLYERLGFKPVTQRMEMPV